MWDDLIRTYDTLAGSGRVAPIAHARITANIGIMLDKSSNILGAAKIHERIHVPCTAKSECRSGTGAYPHLIDDNVSYVADLGSDRHRKYMQQLGDYVQNAASEDSRAAIVYRYLQNNTIINDLKYLMDLEDKKNKGMVITFGIAGLPENTVDNDWTKYYLSSLPQNGICAITGLPDYIPDAYPCGIRFPGDRSKLLMANSKDKLTDLPQIRPGYIASQKVIHALQTLCEEPEEPQKIDFRDIVIRAGIAR